MTRKVLLVLIQSAKSYPCNHSFNGNEHLEFQHDPEQHPDLIIQEEPEVFQRGDKTHAFQAVEFPVLDEAVLAAVDDHLAVGARDFKTFQARNDTGCALQDVLQPFGAVIVFPHFIPLKAKFASVFSVAGRNDVNEWQRLDDDLACFVATHVEVLHTTQELRAEVLEGRDKIADSAVFTEQTTLAGGQNIFNSIRHTLIIMESTLGVAAAKKTARGTFCL